MEQMKTENEAAGGLSDLTGVLELADCGSCANIGKHFFGCKDYGFFECAKIECRKQDFRDTRTHLTAEDHYKFFPIQGVRKDSKRDCKYYMRSNEH